MNGKKKIPIPPSVNPDKCITSSPPSLVTQISEHFSSFLKPYIALDTALKNEVFQIRHEVYCKELAFEKINDSGQERDEFDHRSIFLLIQHKASKEFTSCLRLVTSNKANELLPIEKYCLSSIKNKSLSPERFKRNEVAELSRLAVKSTYRRRRTDESTEPVDGEITTDKVFHVDFRRFPFITIGLYIAAAIMGKKKGIRHVYVMMEPRLARSIKFIGINFEQLGPTVNYHGLRAPYYFKSDDFLKNLLPAFQHLYKTIEKEIFLQLTKQC